MFTQSEAPGRVTNFSHWHSMRGFRRNFQHSTGFVYYFTVGSGDTQIPPPKDDLLIISNL